MEHLTRYLSALLLALSMVGNAQAVSLMELIDNNQSIQVEDKLFSEFWWDEGVSNSSLNNFDYDFVGLLNSITVTGLAPIGADPLNPGPGLNFSTDALSVTSDGLYEWIDLFFGFKVTVLDPDLYIKDNSLTLTQGSKTLAGDNGFYIREQVGSSQEAVSDILGDGDLGNKDVEFSWLDADLAGEVDDLDIAKLTDSAQFAPTKEVYVSKNIFVWADNGGDDNDPVTANLQGFEQRFSQTTIPEPETWMLLAVGLMGFVFNSKRRKSL